jgi:hypothetical protein
VGYAYTKISFNADYLKTVDTGLLAHKDNNVTKKLRLAALIIIVSTAGM